MPLFAGWWKLVHAEERFDIERWRTDALNKYGNGGMILPPAPNGVNGPP